MPSSGVQVYMQIKHHVHKRNKSLKKENRWKNIHTCLPGKVTAGPGTVYLIFCSVLSSKIKNHQQSPHYLQRRDEYPPSMIPENPFLTPRILQVKRNNEGGAGPECPGNRFPEDHRGGHWKPTDQCCYLWEAERTCLATCPLKTARPWDAEHTETKAANKTDSLVSLPTTPLPGVSRVPRKYRGGISAHGLHYHWTLLCLGIVFGLLAAYPSALAKLGCGHYTLEKW